MCDSRFLSRTSKVPEEEEEESPTREVSRQKTEAEKVSEQLLAGDAKVKETKQQKLGNLGSDLRDFLLRVRDRPALDLTVPELPQARSFHSVFTPASDSDVEFRGTGAGVGVGEGNLSLEDAATLSETKFRQGLEASIFFTSDDDGGGAKKEAEKASSQ